MSGLEAQVIRPSAEPAEYPPASYNARQYVDSKGCVFIRAGVDGAVTWVPRVNRSREQLCGATPSNVAGASGQNPAAQLPDLITLAPEDQPGHQPESGGESPPRATTSAAPATIEPQRAPAAAPRKPQRVPAATAAVPAQPVAPAPLVKTPAQSAEPVPVTKPLALPPPVAPQGQGGCAGVSALSQQYINRGADVRCGPQVEDPLSRLTPDSRILPAHLYQQRLQAADLTVPEGYKPAWEDGRLNPHRAEQTIRLTVFEESSQVPEGYALADRDDNRLNRMRGIGTAAGEAQMAQVWSNGVPRRAVPQPEDQARFSLQAARAPFPEAVLTARDPAPVPPVASRLSSRAAADAALPLPAELPQRYVRAATFSDPAEAAVVAQALQAATGLEMRLGTVTRDGVAHKVILSGPYTVGAETALQRIRAAGYSGARLSN